MPRLFVRLAHRERIPDGSRYSRYLMIGAVLFIAERGTGCDPTIKSWYQH